MKVLSQVDFSVVAGGDWLSDCQAACAAVTPIEPTPEVPVEPKPVVPVMSAEDAAFMAAFALDTNPTEVDILVAGILSGLNTCGC